MKLLIVIFSIFHVDSGIKAKAEVVILLYKNY
jgi:hypothetical protein